MCVNTLFYVAEFVVRCGQTRLPTDTPMLHGQGCALCFQQDPDMGQFDQFFGRAYGHAKAALLLEIDKADCGKPEKNLSDRACGTAEFFAQNFCAQLGTMLKTS